MNNKLHIELNETHPIYRWLAVQSDKVGAKGHIGTHLDCYTSIPEKRQYLLSTYIIDCSKSMPNTALCHTLPSLAGKALILYTQNMERNGYGSELYIEEKSFLSKETLSIILSKSPLFILIDSHGIGSHGKEHIEYDKLCEESGCHVIENIYLTDECVEGLGIIEIDIDLDNISTGKPCLLYCRGGVE